MALLPPDPKFTANGTIVPFAAKNKIYRKWHYYPWWFGRVTDLTPVSLKFSFTFRVVSILNKPPLPSAKMRKGPVRYYPSSRCTWRSIDLHPNDLKTNKLKLRLQKKWNEFVSSVWTIKRIDIEKEYFSCRFENRLEGLGRASLTFGSDTSKRGGGMVEVMGGVIVPFAVKSKIYRKWHYSAICGKFRVWG